MKMFESENQTNKQSNVSVLFFLFNNPPQSKNNSFILVVSVRNMNNQNTFITFETHIKEFEYFIFVRPNITCHRSSFFYIDEIYLTLFTLLKTCHMVGWKLLRYYGLNCIIYGIFIMMTTELIVFGIFVIAVNSEAVSTYPIIITHRMISYVLAWSIHPHEKWKKRVSNKSNTIE